MTGRQVAPPEPAPTVLALDEIEEGVTETAFEIGADDLGLTDKFFSFPGPLRIALRIGRGLQTFNIGGTVSLTVTGECCRCLSPVEQPLEAQLQLLLQRREASEDELEAYADEDGVEIVDPGAREYDLSERLAEAVALELPMRVYCRDDCKGLCPTCGTDLNNSTCDCDSATVDPRWEALARLKGPEKPEQ